MRDVAAASQVLAGLRGEIEGLVGLRARRVELLEAAARAVRGPAAEEVWRAGSAEVEELSLTIRRLEWYADLFSDELVRAQAAAVAADPLNGTTASGGTWGGAGSGGNWQ